MVNAARTYGEIRHGSLRVGAAPVFAIRCEPHVMMRLKRIFPRAYRNLPGLIQMMDTPEIASDLRWIISRWPMLMDEATADHLHARAQEYDERQSTITSILEGYIPPGEYMETALPLREYQELPAQLVWASGALLCVDDIGLGKTAEGLAVLRRPDALPAAVVTLTHLPAQWQAEAARFLPLLRSHIITKSQPYDVARKGFEPDILFLSYSKLAGWEDFLAGKVRTVIFDEMQDLRRSGTLKYTAAEHIANEAEYRMGLTATPVYNYGGEIYNVVNILDPEILGSREEFGREWNVAMSTKDKVADPEALGSFLRDQGIMLVRSRADVGRQLPTDPQRIAYPIELDEEVLRDETAGALELARKIIDRSGSPQELFTAAGDFDWRLRHATGLAKARFVADFTRMLLETGEPILLYGWHHDVYEVWRERLADHKPVFFTGRESVNQKRDAKEAFLSGRTDLLVMSLRAGAGIDGLQARCSVCVFGELDWSPGVHTQDIGRIDRDGQAKPVVAYFPIADSGSDPAMAEVLEIKRHQEEALVHPDRSRLAPIPVDPGERVRILAESFLKQAHETRKDGGHGRSPL